MASFDDSSHRLRDPVNLAEEAFLAEMTLRVDSVKIAERGIF
jgi:hypothetical protein